MLCRCSHLAGGQITVVERCSPGHYGEVCAEGKRFPLVWFVSNYILLFLDLLFRVSPGSLGGGVFNVM